MPASPIILAYHKVSDQPEFGLTTIPVRTFRLQMERLLSLGYQPRTFRDLINGNAGPQDKTVIISFDDGYSCVHENAWPVLRQYEIPAVTFVISDYIGAGNDWEAYPVQRRHRHLTGEQILELHRNGIEIGSHTATHAYLPALTEVRLRDEIFRPKTILENLLSERIHSFCYPYGRYSERVVRMVAEAGYRYATGNSGRGDAGNPYRHLMLPRISVYRNDTLSDFESKLHRYMSASTGFWRDRVIRTAAWTGICKKIIENF